MKQDKILAGVPEADKAPLREIGIGLEAVSGDSKAQLESHLEKLDVSFPLYYGLRIEQMYSGLKWIREHDYPIRGTYP